MDKLTGYRQIIQDLLHEHTIYNQPNDPIETEEIVDLARDRYQLLNIGWQGNKRVFGCTLHIEIKNGKIWVEVDRTEDGFANRLVERGIPKQDIVLGFQAKYRRPYTEFAVE